MNHPPRKSVTVARTKAAAVQDEVRQAEADLHDANQVLSDATVGTIVTKESVQAALVQNLSVEVQLHDAARELRVVTDLLRTADGENADRGTESSMLPGNRSGEGVHSLIEEMAASAKREGLDR